MVMAANLSSTLWESQKHDFSMQKCRVMWISTALARAVGG